MAMLLKHAPLLRHLLMTLLLLCCVNSYGQSHAPLLSDAEKLVEIAPAQAHEIAQRFLDSRKLVSEENAQGIKTMGRDESDNNLRTPKTSIDALLIMARARLMMRNEHSALQVSERAESLAAEYQLPAEHIETGIFKADLLWQVYGSHKRIEPLLAKLEQSLTQEPLPSLIQQTLTFRLLLLKAKIASTLGQLEASDDYFEQAEAIVEQLKMPELEIEFALTSGRHNAAYKRFNRALYLLLSAYWEAVGKDLPSLLAKTNRQLGELYFQRNVYDKAIDHLSQAADFYDNYGHSVLLSDVLNNMADIYYLQGRYNLALVHYFNVLDGESREHDPADIIRLRLNLAQTYLQLYNIPLAELYIAQAEQRLTLTGYNELKARAQLLQAELKSQLTQYQKALDHARNGLNISKQINNSDLQQKAHQLLAGIYEKLSDYQQAYQHALQYSKLTTREQNQLVQITEDEFTQQKQFIERSIHYASLDEKIALSQKERASFQTAALALFILSAILVLLFIRRGMKISNMSSKLDELYSDHYTHPRSGLRNLRLLYVKLPSSLEQSSANFEQWQTGELIHEPLHDKLRFLMVDLPFLRTTYLTRGYKAGLELEKQFGEYIKTRIERPARLYHFSDALFLYVAPNTDPNKTAHQLFEEFNQWVNEFNPDQNIERKIRAGIADYPFLPRAYTAINDKELIDILLMATNMARELSLEHGGNQWVCLQAIENAPAASFAGSDIRTACRQAVAKGLIKIQSSHKIEDEIIINGQGD